MSLLRKAQKIITPRVLIFVCIILLLICWPFGTSSSTQRVIQSGSPLFASLNPSKTHKSTVEAAAAVCKAHDFPVWRSSGRKVYDLTMITTELDWLEIRLHTLAQYVDYFVVIESPTTFTGLKKPLLLQENWARFEKFHHKIIHHIVEDEVTTDRLWDHEAFFRNSLLTKVFPTLAGTEMEAKQGDVLIVNDMDEIVRPETAMLLRYCDFPSRLTLRSQFFYYAYQWQHRGPQWAHPQATTFGSSVKNTLLPEALRMNLLDNGFSAFAAYRRWRGQSTLWNAGWHCSFCFTTIEEVQSKMASFSHQAWNTASNRDPRTIIQRFQNGTDLFGRPGENYDKNVWMTDVPEYVMEQFYATGAFGYLLDRTLSQYAEFTDGETMLTP